MDNRKPLYLYEEQDNWPSYRSVFCIASEYHDVFDSSELVLFENYELKQWAERLGQEKVLWHDNKQELLENFYKKYGAEYIVVEPKTQIALEEEVSVEVEDD